MFYDSVCCLPSLIPVISFPIPSVPLFIFCHLLCRHHFSKSHCPLSPQFNPFFICLVLVYLFFSSLLLQSLSVHLLYFLSLFFAGLSLFLSHSQTQGWLVRTRLSLYENIRTEQATVWTNIILFVFVTIMNEDEESYMHPCVCVCQCFFSFRRRRSNSFIIKVALTCCMSFLVI